jgi:predicted nucleic acid-binding protein
VKAELAHANAPAIVRAWISQSPPWLEVVSLKLPVDSALAHLDAGEREAISLASELQATLLLMDERDGVTIARHRGLKVVGTLAAFCHGRGREFESRRPRHFFQALTGSARFSRGHKKAQNRYT